MDTALIIKTLRTRAGFTQKELAKRIKMSSAIVYEWEKGNASPKVDSFVAVCRACGYEILIRKRYDGKYL
jgi:transcriptional regulator with XRE-family HTH domain